MMQATSAEPRSALPTEVDDGHALAAALFGVLWRLRRLPVVDGIEKGALLVLGEAAQLGPVRASTLAAEIRLDLSTVSRHLRALSDAGMVSRSTDSTDARAQVITVTRQGQALLAKALASRAAALAPAVADWDPADVRTLETLLLRLAEDVTPPATLAPHLSHTPRHAPTEKDVL
jgi:DNA-binding MarR family transcriptional regulator